MKPIKQLLFIIERQGENIDRMEREIEALRRHVATMAGDLRTICPVLDEANRAGDPEQARETVRQYYAGLAASANLESRRPEPEARQLLPIRDSAARS